VKNTAVNLVSRSLLSCFRFDVTPQRQPTNALSHFFFLVLQTTAKCFVCSVAKYKSKREFFLSNLRANKSTEESKQKTKRLYFSPLGDSLRCAAAALHLSYLPGAAVASAVESCGRWWRRGSGPRWRSPRTDQLRCPSRRRS
jgi:hypothetical protein